MEFGRVKQLVFSEAAHYKRRVKQCEENKKVGDQTVSFYSQRYAALYSLAVDCLEIKKSEFNERFNALLGE